MKKQSGFTVVELVLVVIVLAGLAATGYVVWHRSHKTTPTTATTSSSNSASTTVPSAPQIKSSSDLNTALQALDQTNVSAGNTDSSELNTQASAF